MRVRQNRNVRAHLDRDHPLRKKVERAITERGLGSLANSTKWEELSAALRPFNLGYRFKLVIDTEPKLDNEWLWSPGFPWEALAWLEITPVDVHRFPGSPDVQRKGEVQEILNRVGLEHRLTDRGTFRVFGYGPLHEIDR